MPNSVRTNVPALTYSIVDLRDFEKASVLVIGDIMLDRYWWGRVDRISPEAPVPVVNLERTTLSPGGAANVATNVVALGASAFLIGRIGCDDDGQRLIESLHASGLSGEHLIRVESRRTSVKTRIVAHSQQVARVDSEDTNGLDETEAAKVDEMISALLPSVNAVIVSDYGKGFLSRTILAKLISACNDSAKTVLVDPKGKDFSKYEGATILTPNRREAADACRLDESTSELVRTAGEQLLRDFGFSGVLITEGEHGMTFFGPSETFHIDASAHQVFDVTGAGDTVIATLAVAIAAGYDLRSAAELANTAAGIAIEKVGAAVVTREMLGVKI